MARRQSQYYQSSAEILHGYTSKNYSRRVNFNPAEKRELSRLFNATNGKQIVEIPRLKREKTAAYEQRVKEIQGAHGGTVKGLRGVPVQLPPGAENLRINKDKIFYTIKGRKGDRDIKYHRAPPRGTLKESAARVKKGVRYPFDIFTQIENKQTQWGRRIHDKNEYEEYLDEVRDYIEQYGLGKYRITFVIRTIGAQRKKKRGKKKK